MWRQAVLENLLCIAYTVLALVQYSGAAQFGTVWHRKMANVTRYCTEVYHTEPIQCSVNVVLVTIIRRFHGTEKDPVSVIICRSPGHGCCIVHTVSIPTTIISCFVSTICSVQCGSGINDYWSQVMHGQELSPIV